MFDFLYTNEGIVTVDDGEILTVEFGNSVRLSYNGQKMFGYLDAKGQIYHISFSVESIDDEILWLKDYGEAMAIPLSMNAEREYPKFGYLPAIKRAYKEDGSSYPVIEVDSPILSIVPSILTVK